MTESGETDRRKRGRPRAKEEMTTISARISSRHHDRLASLAVRHGRSVSYVVRRVIVLALKDDPQDFPY